MDTEQEERPKGVHCSESGAEDTVNTHEGEVSEENKAGKGCDEQKRQRQLHALNVTEAIARYGKSQGDQVARHPRLLNWGDLPAEKTERLTRNLHEWKLQFQPGGNKPTLRKQDSASRDLGSRNKKNRTFLKLDAFRRVKAVTTGGTEKWPKKGGEA